MKSLRYTFGHIKIGEKAKKYLQRSIDRQWVSAGCNVKDFENLFRETFSYKEAVAVSSGTAACFTSLAALHEFGATWGNEVIVPALSFVATSNAVLAAGFKPVFVDIDRKTLNIDPSKIETKITPQTRAIQVVHTMGKPCEMDTILDLARKYNLHVLEDSCEAHGAKYKGHTVGGIGLSGAFSFYAAHIICSGEGGMVSSNDEEYAKILRSVRSHGRPDGETYFQFDRYGFNCKMNDLEAAIGLEGMENFESIFQTRKNNLNYLLKNNDDLNEYFYFLEEKPHEVISPHAFSLVFKEKIKNDMNHLYKYLLENGVQVKTLFSSLPTQHKVFSFLKHTLGDFPEAEYVGNKGLHFGCHQYLTKDDLDFASELLHDYVRKYI